MSAPKRLLDDPETADVLRTDLRAAQQHQVAYDLTLGLSRFEANLPNIGRSGSSLGSLKSALMKLGIVGVAGGALLIAASLYSEQTSTDSEGFAPNSPVEPALEQPPASEGPLLPSEPTSAPPPPEDSVAPQEQVKPVQSNSIERPRASRTAKSPKLQPQSRDDLLAEEVKHLRTIRQALPGNPQQALLWANQGHSQFAQGVLYQEREALALQALKALGRQAELERRGASYLEAFPSGSFSNQVRQLLKR